MNHKYKFTETWFDEAAKPNWVNIFYNIKPIKILEVGCFEGKATTWLCDNVNTIKEYHVIDTFQGSDESGMVDFKSKKIDLESVFKHNISYHSNIDFKIHKGFSQYILPTLKLKDYFDFIYIDGSHRADDTFVDAYYANKYLKSGGLLIFDDFGWKDPRDLSIVNSPELAIRMFFSMYPNYTPILTGYQVAAIKN